MSGFINNYPGLGEALEECQGKINEILGPGVKLGIEVKLTLDVHDSASSSLPETDWLAIVVSRVCKVPWISITSPSRKPKLVIARNIYSYFSVKVCRRTLTQTCGIIHRKTHTSIIHAIKTVRNMIETNDAEYMPLIRAIEKEVLP